MSALSVAECHAQGGRLVYVGDRPACELSTGDGDVIRLALDSGLPIVGPVPDAPKDKGTGAFAAVLFFGVSVLALLFSRRRGR